MINDSTPPDSGFEQAFNELTDTSIEPSESPELEEAAEQVVEEIEEVENEIVVPVEEEIDYKALYEKEEQHRKTVEGRFRKAREEWKDREESVKTVEQDTPTVAVVDHTEFWTDYEIMRKPVEDLITQMLDERLSSFKQNVETVKTQVEAVSAESHFAAISAKHPDYREIGSSQEIKDWMNSLPYRSEDGTLDGEWAWKVFNGGNSQEVIDLFTAFKNAGTLGEKETKITKEPATQPLVDKLVAGLAVDSSSSSLPKTTGKEQLSFEEEFKTFLK